MLLDSPYDVGTPVLGPTAGAVAGLAAALAMLAFIGALQPVSGQELVGVLILIGGIVFPASVQVVDGPAPVLVGLVVHGGLGALFGVLYAVCQRRAPRRGLIGVGIFYGFVLWVVGGLLVGLLFGDPLHASVRSWTWLTACLVYGLGLAAAAIWQKHQRPVGASTPVPLD